MVARNQARPGDFAIMYRTNAQSRLLEEAFLGAGLPYKLIGAQRFYGRREVKDIVAYLRLVHNPNDEVSLTRVINTPPRGIGNKTLVALRTYAQKLSLTPGELLLKMSPGKTIGGGDTIPARQLAALEKFSSLLMRWREQAPTLSPVYLMDRILEDIDYQTYLDDGTEEGNERWENVLELRRLAAEFQDQGLDPFLEQVALVSDADTIETSANVPTLMTLHAAKGLEFPVVFIVGLNDGTLPHSRSFDDPDGMQEERRLFYVGITRAKDRLYLIHAQNRSAYGYAEPVEPSRFLNDIPMDLLEEIQQGRTARRSRGGVGGYQGRWQPAGGASAPIVQQRFTPGMRVYHPVFAEGMVLNSRIQDDDEIVDIFFENAGLKRVAASLARLEIRS
jgi:DNA helicase-2/ATP-dependent DNA helicase PcrA